MASEAAETLTNALLDAVKFGNAEAVRRLLEAGAEPDRRPRNTTNGNRPLTKLIHGMLFAAEFNKVHRTLCPAPVGLPEMFKPWYQSPGADPVGCCAALLEAGASPNLIPGDLYEAPIFSAIHASPTVLELLIGAGADVNVTEQHGETALAHACRFGFSQQVAALLAAGADVNAIPRRWGPGWVWRLYQRPRRVISLLLRAGVALPQPGTLYTVKVQRAGGFERYEAQMKISLATIFIDKFPVGLPIAPLRTIVEFWAHAGDY